MTQRSSQSGFTLIEILVVIVLVSLIMGIGVIGVRGSDRRVLSMSAEDLSLTVAKAAIYARDTMAPVALFYVPADEVNPANYYLASAAKAESLGWFAASNTQQTEQAQNFSGALDSAPSSPDVWTPIPQTRVELIKGIQLSITPKDQPALSTEIGETPQLSWSAAGITQSAQVVFGLGQTTLSFELSPNSRLRPPNQES